MDSGISLNGDTISSPDSDNSSQHRIQNQTVSIELELKRISLILMFNLEKKIFDLM